MSLAAAVIGLDTGREVRVDATWGRFEQVLEHHQK